ncbi:DedA family protein [Paenibacillus rhizovicinus]|uniref:DedA family protein n=1 Tax=Paenibacillus rhizovicinus TaxID=2704463 RepID=A0A6C0P6D7_9BACL|nr:DedA family protein [Paenibacillus rhizovicinus]QHW33886.1 DedA family protein [Paenibacillus rhizovicinus]
MENLLELLIMRYGYFGLTLALSLGIVGVPVPDEALLTYSGYLVGDGRLLAPLVVLSAFLGAAIGITASYMIGNRFGLPFLLKYGPRVRLSPAKIERAQGWMNRYGKLLLFAGFFIPGLRHVTAYMAGMSRFKLRTFLLYAYAGALVWSTLFIYVGYMLGEEWETVKTYVHHNARTLLFIACVLALVALIFRVMLNGRKVKA